jgi:hypothetical protein
MGDRLPLEQSRVDASLMEMYCSPTADRQNLQSDLESETRQFMCEHNFD